MKRLLLFLLLLTLPGAAQPNQYRALDLRFSLSLDMVPSKLMRLGPRGEASADWQWPSMSDPQLGLFLHRLPRSQEPPEQLLAKEKEWFFASKEPLGPRKQTRRLMGQSVKVSEESIPGGTRHTCLIPVEQGWVFLALSVQDRLPRKTLERTWSDLSATLRTL